MLLTLHIENVAVIEKADVEFSPGLNVLTGETGAGKSIVIDSLGAVLGGRTSRELVRTGADSASVTAVFTAEGTEDWCADNEIDVEDGELILSRKITADGKNRCRINGLPVSVTQLKSLGVRLLDIHGQNDGQRLLDERCHRDYLDSFGKLEKDVEAYGEEFKKYRAIKRELDGLNMDEREKERRIDTLRYQIEELTRAEIKPGEQEEKQKRRKLLQNAGRISDAVDNAYEALYGGERSEGALGLITDAQRAVGQAMRYSEEFGEIDKALTELEYAAADVAEQLRDMRSELDFSPRELDDIETRLSQLRKLSLKYGSTEEDMLAYLEKCEKELDDIEYASDKVEKLAKQLEVQYDKTKKCAVLLTEKRKKAAIELEKRIKSELSGLSMPNVTFRVVFEESSDITAFGIDEVRFEMSANAGEKPGRISKIASGGELARIMLAMKNVLAENEPIGTMVFDEVDTGVSGIAAQRVGEKLAVLAGIKQVLCVTHLPQIAAMADEHYEIKKSEKGGRTFTNVTKLSMEEREREIARLTGGENITETTLRSAREQITAAAAFKKR